MIVLEVLFWLSVILILYAHLGYPLVLWALTTLLSTRDSIGVRTPDVEPTPVDLIIAAYDEERVIERKIANALALDYPSDLLRIVVASDGSKDRTVELAREAGADLVLDLPRGGKVA